MREVTAVGTEAACVAEYATKSADTSLRAHRQRRPCEERQADPAVRFHGLRNRTGTAPEPDDGDHPPRCAAPVR